MDSGITDMYALVDPGDTKAVLAEVSHLGQSLFPGHDIAFVRDAFSDTVRLFQGTYPGYRECTTLYHNLEHTMSVMLASMRMFHGAALGGTELDGEDMDKLVACALFHDVGFIQESHDREGTGAKYTVGHEERSIRFLEHYAGERSFSAEAIRDCRHIISATDMNLSLRDLDFRTPQAATLGRILGASDLLAQMADRAYLEKLLLLYREFQEAGVPGFDTELELLKKTQHFYQTVQNRLLTEYGGVGSWLKHHFRNRWSINRDMYREALERNMNYLNDILADSRESFCDRLRRSGIVKQLNGQCDPRGNS